MRDAGAAGKRSAPGAIIAPMSEAPMSETSTVESPCVGVCAIDEASGLCAGCARTIDEIVAWGRADVDAKRRVLELARERRERRDATAPGAPDGS